MTAVYFVTATPPKPLGNHPWDFQGGFFPRKLRYRVDAIKLAQEAHHKGGTNIVVTSPSGKVIKWD
jgi:hypothetical protein